MIALLIKASLIILVLWLFYKIFLEQESFYMANRIYLLGCLVFAFLIPFIALPDLIENQGIVSSLIKTFQNTEIAKEKEINQKTVMHPDTTIGESSNPILHEPNNSSTVQNRRFYFWLILIYFFGVFVLTINLIVQITNTLYKVIRNKDQIVDDEGIIVNMEGNVEPCSFFNYIFINPSSYDYDTYEQILTHEKIHVKQYHSIDLLLSEIAIILLWFNPFVWLMRKEVIKNIEYQTDDLLLTKVPEEKETYQLNLLKIATYTHPLNITTNYNQSLIKKRILKMNSKKSNINSYWKYAFIAPMLLMMLLAINPPYNAMAQNSAALSFVEKEDAIKADKLPTGCQDLLEAAKANSVEEVKTVLKNFDPICMPRATQQDFENIEYIKFLINHEGEVSVDTWNERIIIEGRQLQIIAADSTGLFKQDITDTDGLKIHSKCKELNEAINKGEKDQVKSILMNLKADCLLNPTKENLAHLKHQQELLSKGAQIDLASVKVIMGFEELY